MVEKELFLKSIKEYRHEMIIDYIDMENFIFENYQLLGNEPLKNKLLPYIDRLPQVEGYNVYVSKPMVKGERKWALRLFVFTEDLTEHSRLTIKLRLNELRETLKKQTS